MSTEAYVRDPRFEPHGCAIKCSPDLPAKWWSREELKDVFSEFDWKNTAVLCHHTQFDGLILAHRFGIRPKAWLCTLSMSRLLLGNHLSVGLDAVRRHFGLPLKSTPYNLFRGKHWEELSPATQYQVAEGACDEVESIYKIFNILAKDFPRSEYEVVDATVRMFTEPVLRADLDMLAKIWEDENARKGDRLTALGITAGDLHSSDRFADLLRAEGVDPETKDGKNGPIYAFAKTDQFMRDLLEDQNDRVRALAEARLGEKSTLMQTRAETLGWMARRGPLCVYVRYAGAHTCRDSGGDRSNFLNLRRADPDNPTKVSPIRRAILAPEGYWLAPIDKSQIECRILNMLAGQEDVIEKFRNKEDPYIGIASIAYGEKVYKAKPDDPRYQEMLQKRGTGKQLELSCGYMAGTETIQNTAKLGIYGPPVYIDLLTAERWRDVYRETHPMVVSYWREAGRMIARIAGGPPLEWGPMLIKDKRIYGPGGTMLKYDTLEFHKPAPGEEGVKAIEMGGFWRYRSRSGWAKLYSGKLVENVVQWLARIMFMQDCMRIRRRGYRIANRTYDEALVLIPKDGREEEHLRICIDEMRHAPEWMPDIPLDAEGALSDRYEK